MRSNGPRILRSGEVLARRFRAVRRFAVDALDDVGEAGVAEVLAAPSVR